MLWGEFRSLCMYRLHKIYHNTGKNQSVKNESADARPASAVNPQKPLSRYVWLSQPAPPIDRINQSGAPVAGEYETTNNSESDRANNRYHVTSAEVTRL